MTQTSPALTLSPDQATAWDRLAETFQEAGIDLIAEEVAPATEGKGRVMAVIGKAGSGKTLILSQMTKALLAAGVDLISPDWEGRRRKDRRSVAILAPTNKAAFVLRMRGVPATTIHRILYTPVYDPEYEKIAEWLTGQGDRPNIEALEDVALDRALAFYQQHASIPGALAAAGLRGSDFIRGWSRREEGLDVGLIDEASMLDEKQFDDLREIFPTLVLFGDPAQLAPVGQSGEMVFDRLAPQQRLYLDRIHRQSDDSPILDLAHALADDSLTFDAFERMIRDAARRDDRVVWSERVESDLMSRSPVLVWRNATRIRLIHAFRTAFGAPGDALLPGEPLVCDGIELPLKHRKKRIDLEARGLIKGAQVVYMGPGRKPGFSRLHVIGAEDPRLSAASIVKIELLDEEEPFIPFAARMGATFLHGAAITIHKSQGSQWRDVQVFAPDISAAAWSNRNEAGIQLWKRLAYVAITRAQERLIWVTKPRLARPSAPLGTDDLPSPNTALTLEGQE
ncbi:AAA family ATPase [Paracoccus sp. 1_MG-2023]|uniref:ATP-dependent DNA helicase n=1 Tax=unclassified Paracoccus (in: a-proteobacteria) TaxID=2688777 RepID=UPI001C088A30|nr:MULTISPECIES: AAA family ATPase [unclassified Paracoccus (in: a-proteobacteria)]MBU2957553.1 AAA family ATPase [Paracoccus sp. C2R09]MDO6669787.1 AAA family ATPase [Paracoccus sp. 1_MG-2023]